MDCLTFLEVGVCAIELDMAVVFVNGAWPES